MAASRHKEFICKCFYTRNVFIKKYKLHVTFHNENQFFEEYRQNLRMKGCTTDGQYEAVLNEIKKEISRRKTLHKDALERRQIISHDYHRLHPHLWDFKLSYLDDRLRKIVDSAHQTSDIDEMRKKILENGGSVLGNNLYRLPIFSSIFCEQLVEELFHFEASPCPKGRPNTMSNYGISLDEMGISEATLIPLIVEYIQPLSSVLFKSFCIERLDSFRAFSVLYEPEKDIELSKHFDNAEVTLNVCLTSQFESGELEFGGLLDDEASQFEKEVVSHKFGYGVLHLGQHIHQALPLVAGTRCNLVIWMRSSSIRNKFCKMCGSEPDLVEVPFAGDGFTLPCDQPWNCAAL